MGGSRGRRLRPVALLTLLALVTLPASVAAGPGPYRLGPGDLLAIGVWGHADLQVTAEVRPDGYVSFPLAGDVLAQGRTPEELGREIASKLGRFVRDPQVTVSVARFRTLKVVILGEVSRPGAYEVPPGARLPDLLGLGGGVLEQADLSHAVLTRRARDATRTVPVDLGRVLEGGPGTESPELEDGDVLYVPRARPAMVLGQVRNPGAHPVRPGMKVAELLALAGGLEDDADPRAARLTRRPDGESAEEVLPVDLAAALEDPTSKSNVTVRPGDLLWVPQARQVLVLGAVQAPGAYRLPPGSRLLDALAAAGGPVPERASSTALLTRAGEARSTPIPLDQLVGGGGTAPAANVELRPGDVVFVPETVRQVAVLGEVVRPGALAVRPGMTLQDLVALAGGLTQDADAGRATLSRTLADGTRQAIPVDLTGIVDPHSGVPVPPVALQPGDTLVVPGVVRQVAVMGEVARPGLVPYRPGLTLAEALAAAGGPTEQAELGRVSLTRRAREARDGAAPAIELDLSSLGRQTSADATLVAAPAGAGMLLQPGDLVLVPRAQREVFVLGAVERPGSYPVRPGARVLDALAMAGGPRSDGEAVATLLSRPDGAHRTIDVERLVRDPASPDNVPLQPGDLLYIPPLRQVLVLGEVGRPGAYVPPPGARILDLLALAGGVRPDVAVTDIILTRGVRGASAAAVSPAPPDAAGSVPAAAGRPAATQPQADGHAPLVYHLDYERLVSGQLPESNMPVQDGDVLYVPATRRDVLVMGEVQRPGLYVLPSPGPVRLLDVLALAGGPTKRAVLESVGIMRAEGTPERAAAGRGAVLFQGNASDNPPIRAGDIVVVPETRWPDWSQVVGALSAVKLFRDLMTGK